MTSARSFGRVLVTGGEGFIGSFLVARAAASGAAVTSLDDGSSPAAAGAPVTDGVVRVRGTVEDRDVVAALVADADAVFHLAARVGVRRVLDDPLATLEGNTAGTQVVLDACVQHRVPVLYASSSEVYGHGASVPFRESDPIVLGPPEQSRWTYAVSKLHGEHLGLSLAARYGLRFLAVRFFNVVGPGQRGDQGMVLPRFVASALAGRPLIVHGPGTQRRTFLHARDAAEAIWGLLSMHSGPAEVINVGSEERLSIVELAERVRRVVGSGSPIEIVAPETLMPPGFVEVADRWPSLDRLRARVGEVAHTPIDETIAQVAEALRLAEIVEY